MGYLAKLTDNYRKFTDNYQNRKRELWEKGFRSYFTKEGGYVLVIVLIIITLLVSISSEFIVMAQTEIGYNRKLSNRLKAGYLAKSGIQVGKFLLYLDLKGLGAEQLAGRTVDKDVDSYNDIWALDIPEMPMGDGSLKLNIIDENSKINLSVVANEYTDRTKFYYFTQNFFMNMGFKPDFADIIHDWVDPDDSPMPYGAESNYYQTLKPPYSAKNNAMDSIDELLLIKDMTPQIYYGLGGGNFNAEKKEQNLVDNNHGDTSLGLDKLKEIMQVPGGEKIPEKKKDILTKIGKEKSRALSDYFTVYGERADFLSDMNKININTASYRVLSALTDRMTPDIVTEIINRRLVRPYKSVDEIKDLITDEEIRKRLSTKSNIFRIIATATVNDVQVKITAVYNRTMRILFYWCEE
jgi:type II secretory pathway component PulK